MIDRISVTKAAHGKARLMRHVMLWAFRILGRLAPALVASWAYRLWFTPPRYRAPDREQRYEQAAQRGVPTSRSIARRDLSLGRGTSGVAYARLGWARHATAQLHWPTPRARLSGDSAGWSGSW